MVTIRIIPKAVARTFNRKFRPIEPFITETRADGITKSIADSALDSFVDKLQARHRIKQSWLESFRKRKMYESSHLFEIDVIKRMQASTILQEIREGTRKELHDEKREFFEVAAVLEKLLESKKIEPQRETTHLAIVPLANGKYAVAEFSDFSDYNWFKRVTYHEP